MKYPAVVMTGPKAHGEVLSVAYAVPVSTRTRAPR